MTIPYVHTAEVHILGSCLFDNTCFEACEAVRIEDFYHPLHQELWAAMLRLRERRMVVDLGSLMQELAGTATLTDHRETMLGLIDYALVPYEVGMQVKMLTDAARRRDMILVADEMKAVAIGRGEGYVEPDEVLESIDAALEPLRERQALHAPIESCADADDLFAVNERDSLVKTGLPELDRVARGFERGALSIIAARPGVGKTAFAICVAEHIAQTESVGFLSLDMQGRVIKQRLACLLHFKQPGHRRAIYVSQLKEPDLLAEETKQELRDLIRGDVGRRILVNDRGGQNTRSVASQIRGWHRYCAKAGLPPLGAVFIDHIAKVAPAQKAGGLYEKTSYAANELLDIAKANPRTALIALCQLSRDSEKAARRPLISDLRDSGKIEEDASLVLLLHREDMKWSMIAKNPANSPEDIAAAKRELLKCTGDFEVIIGKNRNGEQGAVKLWHNIGANVVADNRGRLEEVG